MDHNKIIKKCLQYLNITFGVLMIVVLSLNIEQIFHNKRITRIDFSNDNDNKHDKTFHIHLYEKCQDCQNEAYIKISILNIQGALLATTLGFFSFLMAFNMRFYVNQHKWLLPTCFVASFLTCIYFVFTVISKLPKNCINITLRQDMHCDIDFEYNMENKVVPLSVLMLVLVPQFVVRSIAIILIKYFYKKKDKIKTVRISSYYNNRTGFGYDAYDDGTNTTNNVRDSFINKKKKRARDTDKIKIASDEFEMIKKPSIVYGYRELPVDCPNSKVDSESEKTQNQIDDRSSDSSNNIYENDESLIEKARRYSNSYEQNDVIKSFYYTQSQMDKISDEILDEIIVTDTNNNNSYEHNQDLKLGHNVNLISKRTFVRNSSLSTISEEKTLATLTDMSPSMNSIKDCKNTKINESFTGRFLIETLLNEFKDKTILINEILNVFEPSSKDGNFNRNVPIRLSSPQKSQRSYNTTSSSSSLTPSSVSTSFSSFTSQSPIYTSICKSPSDFKRLSWPSIQENKFSLLEKSNVTSSNTTNNSNSSNNSKLLAKKVRLIKRLKMRIETKRGKPLFSKKNNKDINKSTINRSASIYSRINHNNKSKNRIAIDMVKQIDVENKEITKLYSITHTFKSADEYVMDKLQAEEKKSIYQDRSNHYINSDFNLDLDLSKAPNIVANTDVEPAFF